jgi:hypothetical protein
VVFCFNINLLKIKNAIALHIATSNTVEVTMYDEEQSILFLARHNHGL